MSILREHPEATTITAPLSNAGGPQRHTKGARGDVRASPATEGFERFGRLHAAADAHVVDPSLYGVADLVGVAIRDARPAAGDEGQVADVMPTVRAVQLGHVAKYTSRHVTTRGSNPTLNRSAQGQIVRLRCFARVREAINAGDPTLSKVKGRQGRVKSFRPIRAHTHAAVNPAMCHYPTLAVWR